jgi:regulator of sigma E protease
VAVSTYNEIVEQIQAHEIGDEVVLTYVVDGVEQSVRVELAKNPESDTPFLGSSPYFTKTRMSPGDAFIASFERLWLTVKGIVGFFTPSNFTESVNNSASVVGIAVIAAEVIKVDPVEYVGLVAAISLSLGLMNLIPIPPLDGGRMVIELLEKIRRRPLSINTNIVVTLVGFTLLFSLMAYLLYVDIGRFFLG